ncbi:MAG: diacylglycerol kinase family protein [Flavobacteriales bacterium]|nr:diacylglycerol kinase family protein [Flavobacteriales bacterium]
MNHKKPFRWIDRMKSFTYAAAGIRMLFVKEHNAWIHALAAVSVIGLGLWLKISLVSWGLVALAIGGVLAAEMFNTAIETLTDMVSPEYHKSAKAVKDLAAGAVLISAIAAAVIGAIVFIPPLWSYFCN